MGWFDDFVDTVGDVADDIGDTVGDVVDTVVETVVDTADAVGGAIGEGFEGFAKGVGDFGGFLGDAIDFTATTFDDALLGIPSTTLNWADDYVFDTVDELTGGVVDVDFDGGALSASLGIDDVFSVSASIGEHGVTAASDNIVSGWEAGLTDQGFSASGSAGIEWGPLPYASGGVELGADGTVSMNGEVQGTIPTPIGFVSVDVEDASFHRTPDGAWGAGIDVDGQLTLPSGTYVGAGVQASYEENAEGDSRTVIAGDASIGQVGVGEVGVEAGYQHVVQDGVTTDQAYVGVEASGYGFEAEAGVDYTRVESDEGVVESVGVSGSVSGYGSSIGGEARYTEGTIGGQSFSDWDADGYASFDAERIAGLASSVLGDELGVELPSDLDGLVGSLGSGGTSALLEQLGGGDLGGFVQSLGATGAGDLASKLVSDGTFGDFLAGADSSTVSSLLGKVAEAGGLEDLLGGLDPATTASVVSQLTAPPPSPAAAAGEVPPAPAAPAAAPEAGVGAPLVDDVLAPEGAMAVPQGAEAVATAPADVATPEPDVVVAEAGADLVGDSAPAVSTMPGEQLTAEQAAELAPPPPEPVDAMEPAVDIAVAPPPPEPVPVPEPAPPPEPVDTFTQQIEAADAVEESVDQMFDGL